MGTLLSLTELNVPMILAFLDYLEHDRGNAVRSRNIRLSTIRSFFRFVALRDPERVELVTRILATLSSVRLSNEGSMCFVSCTNLNKRRKVSRQLATLCGLARLC